MSFLDEANEIVPELLEFRHYIHEHAETGFELPLTTEAITSRLDAMQIPWENVGGGIVATVGSGEKNILVRSEMDALPMPEENDLPFRSHGNKAHMCGHDLNATLLLGTLTLLKKHEAELKGQLVALFQPNEEGSDSPSGAERVYEKGISFPYECQKSAELSELWERPCLWGQLFLPYHLKRKECSWISFLRRKRSDECCHSLI